MRKIPQVSFECTLGTSYGRGVLRGVVNFARVRGPWALRLRTLSPPIKNVEHWNVDGVITCTRDEIASGIRAAGLPAVNVRNTSLHWDLPQLGSDDIAVGRMGAEHFIERGFRQFAFCGTPGQPYSDCRSMGFMQMVREAGFDCFVWQSNSLPYSWDKEEISLNKWMKSLPKPVGIMACHDRQAWRLVEICLHLGLQIPEQVAILGIGNDAFFCEMPYPSLSSIALATDRIGYEAATLLARLMKGEAAPPDPILIPPSGVVTRQSTNTLAIDDPDTAQAINFIREHAGQPIQVEDVLAVVPLSRRVLERRFRQFLKRSPHEEIRRVHVGRAKTLLAESEMSIHEVSLASGFTEAGYFSRTFHESTGMTPTSYRRRFGKR